MHIKDNKVERSFNSGGCFDVVISHGDPTEPHYISICTSVENEETEEHFAIAVDEIPMFIKLLQESMGDFK